MQNGVVYSVSLVMSAHVTTTQPPRGPGSFGGVANQRCWTRYQVIVFDTTSLMHTHDFDSACSCKTWLCGWTVCSVACTHVIHVTAQCCHCTLKCRCWLLVLLQSSPRDVLMNDICRAVCALAFEGGLCIAVLIATCSQQVVSASRPLAAAAWLLPIGTLGVDSLAGSH